MAEKRVFVTVGTTSFDELVAAATEKRFMELLVNKGYTHLTLQIGRGSYEPPTPPKVAGIQLEFYRFKSSIQEDMQKASLILSHGGAGSISESLSLQKPLIVVVNETLMHNHQTELARKMSQEGYCLFTTHNVRRHIWTSRQLILMDTIGVGAAIIAVVASRFLVSFQELVLPSFLLTEYFRGLYDTLQNLNISSLKPYQPGQPEKLGHFLDRVMGFQEKSD